MNVYDIIKYFIINIIIYNLDRSGIIQRIWRWSYRYIRGCDNMCSINGIDNKENVIQKEKKVGDKAYNLLHS